MVRRVAGEPPVARASLRYYRCSPQKVRLVVDQIRGKNVNEALNLLRQSPKAASRDIEKLLRSAVANAERGSEKLDVDTLHVGEAYVGPGPSFKRFRVRAFGRAARILHRTCHITLKLMAPRQAREEAGAAPAPAEANPAKRER